jgi:hypothetical protein
MCMHHVTLKLNKIGREMVENDKVYTCARLSIT